MANKTISHYFLIYLLFVIQLCLVCNSFGQISLDVYMKDEGIHEANIVKPRIYITNNGTSGISDFYFHYLITTENNKTPVIENYYTPNSLITLQDIGSGNYIIKYDFSGITLNPGQSLPNQSGNVIGIHYPDWSDFNKLNDFSYLPVSNFNRNDHILVYDSQGNLIYGSDGTQVPTTSTYYWHGNGYFDSNNFNRSSNWTDFSAGGGKWPDGVKDDVFNNLNTSVWSFIDNDNNSSTGNPVLNGNKLEIKASGTDIWYGSNQFVAAKRSDLQGNFDVTVKVVSQTDTDHWGKSGIMVANDIHNLSSGGYAILASTPRSSGVTFQWASNPSFPGEIRSFSSSNVQVNFPVWLRMVKSDGTLKAFYKENLEDLWTQIGSSQSPVNLSTNSQIALFNVSHNPGAISTALFDDFQASSPMVQNNLKFSFGGTGVNSDINSKLTDNFGLAEIDWTGFSGDFNFDSFTLSVTGNVTNSIGYTVTEGTGAIDFTGSGTQIFIPRLNHEMVPIFHSGCGILQLSTNKLVTKGFSNLGGILDFNGNDIEVTSMGDFTIHNGTSSTLTGLSNIKISAEGDIYLIGTSNSLLNLNPSSSWNVDANGSLIAEYSIISNSNSIGSPGLPRNSIDAGGNINWNFEDLSEWNHSAYIDINTQGITNTNLENFPLLVRLSDLNFPFEQAASDGSDIRFSLGGIGRLSHEIEVWDNIEKKGIVWVKVPNVIGNGTTQIKMYWGKTGAQQVSDPKTVFNSNYAAVWHMNTNPAQGVSDATQNNQLGNAISMDESSLIEGHLGIAYQFDGINDYIDLGTMNQDFSKGVTLCGWMNYSSFSNWSRLADIGNGAGNDNIFIANKYSTNDLRFGIHNNQGSVNLDSDNFFPVDSWNYVCGTSDQSGKMAIFLNGEKKGSIQGKLPDNKARAKNYIAKSNWPADALYHGMQDEVRISTVARSEDWIKLSFETQKPNQTNIVIYEDFSTWEYQAALSLNTSPSGANISTTEIIYDFPILVRLNPNNFNFNEAQSSGEDIRFANNNGKPLPFEIETWTATGANIWVKVDKIYPGNKSQYINMYWGKPDAVAKSNGNQVFSSMNYFSGVFHLNELGNNDLDGYKDASSNQRHGTGVGYGPGHVTGVIGNGQFFDGTDDYIRISSDMGKPSDITISGWVNLIAPDISGAEVASIGDIVGIRLDDGSLGGSGGFYQGTGGLNPTLYTSSSISGNGWRYLTYTIESGSNVQRLYMDGIEMASSTYSEPIAYPGSEIFSFVGKHGDGSENYNFNGNLDEIRFSHVARSPSWIKLSFENQRNNGNFVNLIKLRSEDDPIYSSIENLDVNTIHPFTSSGKQFQISNYPFQIFNVIVVTIEAKDGKPLDGFLTASGSKVALSGTSQEILFKERGNSPIIFSIDFTVTREFEVRWSVENRIPRTAIIPRSYTIESGTIQSSYSFSNFNLVPEELSLSFPATAFSNSIPPQFTLLEHNPPGVLNPKKENILTGPTYDIEAELIPGNLIQLAIPIPSQALYKGVDPNTILITHYNEETKNWEEITPDKIENGYIYFTTSSLSLFSSSWKIGVEVLKAVGKGVVQVIDWGVDAAKGLYNFVADGVCSLLDPQTYIDLFVSKETWEPPPAPLDELVSSKQFDPTALISIVEGGRNLDKDCINNVITPEDEIHCWEVYKNNADLLLADVILSHVTGKDRRFTLDKTPITSLGNGLNIPGVNLAPLNLSIIDNLNPAETYYTKDLFAFSSKLLKSAPEILELINKCNDATGLNDELSNTVNDVSSFATNFAQKNLSGVCRDAFNLVGDVVDWVWPDIAQCVGNAVAFKDYYDDKGLGDYWGGQRDAHAIGAGEFFAVFSVLLWVEPNYKMAYSFHAKRLRDQIYSYYGLTHEMYNNNNVPIKSLSGIAMWDWVSKGKLGAYNEMIDLLEDMFGENGGYAEGTGYLNYVNNDVPFIMASLLRANAITRSNLPQKYLKSGEWLKNISRELPGVTSPGGTPLQILLPAEADDGVAGETNFYFYGYLTDEQNFVHFENEFPTPLKSALEYLATPDFTLTAPTPINLPGLYFADGVGIVRANSGANVITLAMNAESGNMRIKGAGHDQQDALSVTLDHSADGRIIVDPGYEGFAERENDIFPRYNFHNVSYIPSSSYGGEEPNQGVLYSDLIDKLPHMDNTFLIETLGLLIFGVHPEIHESDFHAGGSDVQEPVIFQNTANFNSYGMEAKHTNSALATTNRAVLTFGEYMWVVDRAEFQNSLRSQFNWWTDIFNPTSSIKDNAVFSYSIPSTVINPEPYLQNGLTREIAMDGRPLLGDKAQIWTDRSIFDENGIGASPVLIMGYPFEPGVTAQFSTYPCNVGRCMSRTTATKEERIIVPHWTNDGRNINSATNFLGITTGQIILAQRLIPSQTWRIRLIGEESPQIGTWSLSQRTLNSGATGVYDISGPDDSDISVVLANGQTVALNATPEPSPIITGNFPSPLNVGQILTINGMNFSNTPNEISISFGGVQAMITSATTTSISVIVPPGIQTGMLSIEILGRVSNEVAYTALTPGGPPTMVAIPGGTFQMGFDYCLVVNPAPNCADVGEEEKPVHTVTISPFLISAFEISQGEFEAVMGFNPSHFIPPNVPLDLNRPADEISFELAIIYCNARSLLDGYEPVYSFTNIWSNENPYLINITTDFSKNGYRLPTEAEWEYAYRANGPANQVHYWGNDPLSNGIVLPTPEQWAAFQEQCKLYMWFALNANFNTHVRGQLLPNDFGIYDMSGNVAEITNDYYGPYSSGTSLDPTGPNNNADGLRVIRGGNYLTNSGPGGYNNAARRDAIPPRWNLRHNGFRVVRNN